MEKDQPVPSIQVQLAYRGIEANGGEKGGTNEAGDVAD